MRSPSNKIHCDKKVQIAERHSNAEQKVPIVWIRLALAITLNVFSLNVPFWSHLRRFSTSLRNGLGKFLNFLITETNLYVKDLAVFQTVQMRFISPKTAFHPS